MMTGLEREMGMSIEQMYELLTPENKEIVNCQIEKLIEKQSAGRR